MSFGLPNEGDLDWADPVNDSIEATRSDAATAKADSATARDTALQALYIAQAMAGATGSVDASDASIAGRINDDESLTATALSASTVTPQIAVPTSGAGTSGSPFAHSDGSGGIKTAVVAARTSGKVAWVKPGVYTITTKIEGLTGDRIHFEPGVTLVPSGLGATTNMIEVIGSSGTYKSGVVITGAVTIDFSAMGTTYVRGLALEYVKRSLFPVEITVTGGYGNAVRAYKCNTLRLPSFVGVYDRTFVDGVGSAVYLQSVSNSSGLERVYAEGCDEAVDLADCSYITGGHVTNVNGKEPIDIGSSTGCYFLSATSIGCESGVNFKIDAGANATGCVGNRVERVVAIDMAASVSAVNATTVTGDAQPNADNSVGSIYSRTTQTDTRAVMVYAGDATNPITRFTVDNYNHIGPGETLQMKWTVDCSIGDDNSYGEATGDSQVINLSGSGSEVFNHVRPRIRGKVKATSRTGSGNAAVQLFKTDGRGATVWSGHVLGSGAEGIVTYQSKNLRCEGVVEECNLSGMLIRVVDDANYSGSGTRQNMRWRGTMRNIAKTNSGASSGVRVVAESGTPTIRGVHIDRGSEFLDTQGSPTTSVMNFGTADMVSIDAHVDTSVGTPLIGTLPVTRKIRLSGRPTSGNTDAMIALMAGLNSDGPFVGPRILATVTGIDGKTTGTTTLYTVPSGHTAVILGAVVRVTTASAITVAPTLGIGVAAGEDDIFASTTLTGLTSSTKVWRFDAGSGLLTKLAASAVVKLGIDTGATATTQTLAVDLIGYLVV